MDNEGSRVSRLTYRRQRFLLAFICQLNERIAMTNLQKLVFLYEMSVHTGYYDFLPYKYGPYSFQLKSDIELLVKRGFLYNDGVCFCACSSECGDSGHLPAAKERGRALLRKAYTEYPYYTIKSVILRETFSDDADTLRLLENERERYIKKEQVLFTIGYEGRSLESFFNVLLKNGISTLCDVRRNPLSRKFGFSKDMLQSICEQLNIRYIHMPGLGIDSSKRKNLRTREDYNALFNEYELTLPNLREEFCRLYSVLCDNNRVALMCFEKDPRICHRHIVRDFLCGLYSVKSEDL